MSNDNGEDGASVLRIAELNDQVRKQAGGMLSRHEPTSDNPHSVLLTSGVMATVQSDAFDLLTVIRDFDDFTADNDPYGERDFGAVEFAGTKVYWKIDYYDPTKTYGSDDPSDPRQTHRVMTILLPEEY